MSLYVLIASYHSRTELAEQFQGRLKPSYDGASYEVVSTVFSIMTQVDLTTPQSFKRYVDVEELYHVES